MTSTNREQAIRAKIAEIALNEDFVRDTANYPSGEHVGLVFEDGELASTKAGSLLWQRTLHCFYGGEVDKAVPAEWFPYRMKEHGYVFCKHQDGEALRSLILA
jgi:hypothetical protein